MTFKGISREEFLLTVSKYQVLETAVEDYILNLMKRKNELTPDGLEKPYCIDDTYIDSMDENGVFVRVEEYWPYGGHETHYYKITLDELFDSNWEEKYKEQIAIALYNKKLSKEKQREVEELKEREEYERLKKKFELLYKK